MIIAAENASGLPPNNSRLSCAISLSTWLNLDFPIFAAVLSASRTSGVKHAARALAAATSSATDDFSAVSAAIADDPNTTASAMAARTLFMGSFSAGYNCRPESPPVHLGRALVLTRNGCIERIDH